MYTEWNKSDAETNEGADAGVGEPDAGLDTEVLDMNTSGSNSMDAALPPKL